jgi:pimeloyl-ACP methyl ester carboxylesterase
MKAKLRWLRGWTTGPHGFLQEGDTMRNLANGDDFSTEASYWPPAGKGLTRKAVTVCDRQMSYVTGGSGPPLVLLHGLGANSFTWRFVLPTLIQHYTCYAPDMFGCGASDKGAMDYSLNAMAAYVNGFFAALGLQRAHVVGHSLGGGLAMQFAYDFPGHIERLVLVSSGGMGRDMHWLLRISTLPGADGILGMLANPRLRVPEVSRRMEMRRMRRLDQTFDPHTPTMLDRFQSRETRQAFLTMLRNVSTLQGQRVSAVPLLSTLAMPVLLLWGARDSTIPVTHGHQAVALIPNAHLEVLPNCFHRPQLEAPQQFCALVLGFLHAEAWPPVAANDDATAFTVTNANATTMLVLAARRRAALRRLALAPVALAALSVPTSAALLRRRRVRRRAAS